MKWPLVTRRRYENDLAAVDADRARLRAERDQFAKDRDVQRAVARKAAEQFADLDDRYTATVIVNTCLTEELTAARNRIAEYGDRRTVSDVLVEHDVHRKALANALGDQKYHLNWGELIAEVARLNAAAEAWMADHAAEKKRADQLQERLDDAFGLNTPAVEAGAAWGDRRTDKKGHQ
ncbi:hypothetical protein AB0N77_09550 [Streptomyces misionensis]|uniref:hypothetical protein n=1 Tax=Streptomyces misionensis TaxID=67331 RepID=UPI0034364AF8